MDQSQLLQLLAELRSADNEVRKAAESRYDELSQAQPAWMMLALAEVCASSPDNAVVTISLILLRKLLNREPSPYEVADAATQATVRGRVLQVLNAAAFGPQRGSAAACVSALAVKVYQLKQDWSELWTNVLHIMTAAESQTELKTVCCEIVSATACALTEFMNAHADALVTGLRVCLDAPGEAKALKQAAFDATMRLASLGLLEQLSPLVPHMLGGIQDRLNAGDWDSAETLTAALAEGIAQTPALFDGYVEPLLEGMFAVASSTEVGTGARHMAVETLLTFCESQPKRVRAVGAGDFAARLFRLLFKYTLNPDYPTEWDTSSIVQDEYELENDSDQVIGSSGLDRVAIALGGRKLHGTAYQLFMQHINGDTWQERNAAVLLICYIAEGFANVLKSQLNTVLPHIVVRVGDSNKYVRANALDCVSQLSNDFAPDLQNTLHAMVLPAVVRAVCDPVPRVAACAARALDSFFDNVTEEDDDDEDVGKEFAPYVQTVCEQCVALLHTTQHTFVRTSALGALSSLTSTCKALLAPYTDALIPVYKEVLGTPDSTETMQMKCKAIECVTLLACGVGKERFAPYAKDVCDYLCALSSNFDLTNNSSSNTDNTGNRSRDANTTSSGNKDDGSGSGGGAARNDEVRMRFVLRGWTCMVECLKHDVLPYMPHVMPMLIAMMNRQCDAVIVNAGVGESDDDDDDADGNTDSNGQQIETCRFVIPGVGERVAKFHTGLIEDKELATNVANAMLQELGLSLAPYFAELAESALGLLGFTVNASIRENGALILDGILEACSEGKVAESQHLASRALAPLVAALEEESESDVMETMMQVLSRCISMYPGVLTAENVTMVSDKLLATLKVMCDKRQQCVMKKATEHDEDELDDLEGEDEELQESIRSACEVVGTLLQRAGEVFGPLFVARFLPFMQDWLKDDRPDADDFTISRVLTLLCDFVEHTPQLVADRLPHICRVALLYVGTRTEPGLLQSDFYLLNLLTQYFGTHAAGGGGGAVAGGVDVAGFVQATQQAASHYLAAHTAASSEYDDCTCNVVSLCVSLLQYFAATALHDVAATLLQRVVTRLPVGADEVEAVRVHDRVLGWVVHRNALLQTVPRAADEIVARVKTADAKLLSPSAQQQLAAL